MNIKKRISGLVVLTCVFLCFFQVSYAQVNDSLKYKLKNISEIKTFKVLLSGTFKEKYEVFFEQPVDHKNPAGETFYQRVFIMHYDYNAPTIIVTEGYSGDYATNPVYREELARILKANIVFVEHRYFSKSVPESGNWKFLNAENEAADLHLIREEFGKIYKGKWIATGISKGGQNSLIYTYYYPSDMAFTVAYVAPVCRAVEDGRHEKFIAEIAGNPEEREKVLNFQKEVLKRRATLMPKFDSLCKAENYMFRLPQDEIYDYSILEYSFSFWQWGHKAQQIPQATASDNAVFKYWMNISGPEYFVRDSPVTPFFVQAAKELGYYGYDTRPFKSLLKIKSAKGYLTELFLPEGLKIKFDKHLYKKLTRFVKESNNRIMFIYGENDPWTSARINEQNRKNIVFFIDPHGSHRSRISTMPESIRKEAESLLIKWLSE